MRSTFAQKLFRVFILFAFVPTVLLTLAGYYLTTETIELLSGTKVSGEISAHEYYESILARQLADELAPLSAGSAGPRNTDLLADIVIRFDSDQVKSGQIIYGDSLLSALVDTFAQLPTDNRSGYIRSNGQLIFYHTSLGESGERYISAVVHDSIFTTIIDSQLEHDLNSNIENELRKNFSIFVAVIFVTLTAFTIATAYLAAGGLARSMSKPLITLTDAAGKISTGDFKTRVEPTGDGEIRELMISFNEMVEQLSVTTARLTQAERVAAWRGVARRFAHELKNPLQPILISLYQIEKSLKTENDSDKTRELLKSVATEVESLIALAGRFSELAKLPPPKMESCDLKEILLSVTSVYDKESVSFEFDLPAEPVVMPLDITYLREALHNLLRNAIEASAPKATIILSVLPGNHFVDIRVADHGKGMTPEILKKATQPYFTTRESGSGIGLAIVEKIVIDLGGQLLLRSEPGQGTEITIRLPSRIKEQA